jgi:hypothetical protein
MKIKNAPSHFDLSNKGAGESDTFNSRSPDAYDDYETVKTNNMVCTGSNFVDMAPNTVCPTDGAPFEVFSTTQKSDYAGKYGDKSHEHHTAAGQSVRTYRHDLDNTTITFRACDDGKSMWAYSREKFVYVEEDFNITHLIPPEEQIKELDVTKPVKIPKKLGAFRYFGVDYTEVKMSGHGYLAFGNTVHDDFTESISEWGKYKMIAALWDDLNPEGGWNPDKKMGIAKNVYAVHEKVENQMIFQWHFIPETSKNWYAQKTRDENVFRITLDFDTNEIIIKTGVLESKDGIVGLTGGLDKNGVQFGHEHVDFSSDVGCAVPNPDNYKNLNSVLV